MALESTSSGENSYRWHLWLTGSCITVEPPRQHRWLTLLMRPLGMDLQRDWPCLITYHMSSGRGALWGSCGHWEPFPSFHKDMLMGVITTALPIESIGHVQPGRDSNIVLWWCSRPVHDCIRPVGWTGKRLVLKMMDGEGRAPRKGLKVTSGGKSGTHQWRKCGNSQNRTFSSLAKSAWEDW